MANIDVEIITLAFSFDCVTFVVDIEEYIAAPMLWAVYVTVFCQGAYEVDTDEKVVTPLSPVVSVAVVCVDALEIGIEENTVPSFLFVCVAKVCANEPELTLIYIQLIYLHSPLFMLQRFPQTHLVSMLMREMLYPLFWQFVLHRLA